MEIIIGYLSHPDRLWNKVLISDKLREIRHSQIICDPFPEHTLHGRLGWWKDIEPISIWAAYRMGYEKAYKEIEASIGSKELK